MQIEILALSGPALGTGRRWPLAEVSKISIGSAADADILVPVNERARPTGCQLQLSKSDDGWKLANRGSDVVFLDQTMIAPGASSRIRSGQVIRLSREGPDYRFTVAAAPAATSAASDIAASGPRERELRPHSEMPNRPRPSATPDKLPEDKLPEKRIEPVADSVASLPDRVQPVVVTSNTFGRSSLLSRDRVGAALLALAAFAAFILVVKSVAGPQVVVVGAPSASERESSSVVQPPEANAEPASNTAVASRPSMSQSVRLEPSPRNTASPSPATPTRSSNASTEVVTGDDQVNQSQTVTNSLAPSELRDRYENAVVWLCTENLEGKHKGGRLIFGIGFAASPTVAVFRGRNIAQVRAHRDQMRFFVCSQAKTPDARPALNPRVHPAFDESRWADNPPPAANQLHDLGAVDVTRPFSAICQFARFEDIPKPIVGTELTLLSYAVEGQEFLDPLNPPRLIVSSGKVMASNVVPNSGSDMPLLRVEFAAPVPDIYEGAPLFDRSGRVMAVVTGKDGNDGAGSFRLKAVLAEQVVESFTTR